MKKLPMPGGDSLNTLLSYDPDSGILTWKKTRNPNCRMGTSAGCRTKKGYLRICVGGVDYMAHRVIWRMMTGEDPSHLQIDHIDQDPSNNRWSNLRLASQSQNLHNTGRTSRSKRPTPKGVSWSPSGLNWIVSVKIVGSRSYLGAFEDLDAAESVARLARSILHGDFANHGDDISEEDKNSLKTFQSEARRRRTEAAEVRRAARELAKKESMDLYAENRSRKRITARALREGYSSVERMLKIEAARREAAQIVRTLKQGQKEYESYNLTT